MRLSGFQSISTGFAVPLTWFQQNQELDVIAENWRRNKNFEVKVGIGISNLIVPHTKIQRWYEWRVFKTNLFFFRAG